VSSSRSTHDGIPDEEETNMSEDHRIVEVRESLPTSGVGVRVSVRLSGRPSRRWSRGVSSRLASQVVGYASVGHLRLNEIVQDDEIVLEGVEEREAPMLTAALQRAIDATNQALAAERSATATVAQEESDAIAEQIAPGPRATLASAGPASGTGDEAKPSSWFG
jgi:hypothetical protein